MPERGKYIVIDGGDGAGKSTHVALLSSWIKSKGIPCCSVNEPGSTLVAEEIRAVMLHSKNKISPETELFLMEAARSNLFKYGIIPQLESGVYVISDRGADSSKAYQSYAGGLV